MPDKSLQVLAIAVRMTGMYEGSADELLLSQGPLEIAFAPV